MKYTCHHAALAKAAEAVAYAASSEVASLAFEESGEENYQPQWEARGAADCAARALAMNGKARPDLLAARVCQSGLLRDMIGNLSNPVLLDPAWLTPNVFTIVHAAYDERAMPSGELELERLAVLSDALEEAGCTDASVLDHLRSPGRHIRGCWAVDLILGLQ